VAQLIHDPNNYTDLLWTSPIQEFLREDFVLEDEYATSHLTIEDALSHRSGLPRHDFMYGQPGDTPSSVVRRIRYLPMTYQPRTVFQYCNIMFGVMTDLLETLTGHKLETIFRDRLWGPLGMNSTSFSLSSEEDEASPKLARGYYWNPGSDGEIKGTRKDHYVPEPYIDISPISGAGATISTVKDYSLWVKALLDASRNEPNSESPVTGRMVNDLFRPRTIIQFEDDDDDERDTEPLVRPSLYALAWVSVDLFGESVVGHNGGLTGFGTELYMLPGKNFGVVTMGNTAMTSNIAGQIISAQLLIRKIGVDPRNLGALARGHELLRTTFRMDGKRTAGKPPKQLTFPPLRGANLPLPGKLSDFVGAYTHPAYGAINFTIAVAPNGKEVLQAFLYPRLWPQKLQLSHTTDTVFALKVLSPHGLGDIHSDDIVWEDLGWDHLAIFEFGVDGKTVETMGIEIAPEMVEMARTLGVKHWRKGMVWFEKL
jgi:CubicO group peptidase (beta-lactamase class C family)